MIFKNFWSKKAQITIFIIMGIVLVVVAGTIIFLSSEKNELSVEVIEAERAPTEFKPVQDFIESCLNEKLIESFMFIGQHGGYIDMSDPETSGSTFNLDIERPTMSDAAFFANSESSHVAYWWHMNSEDNCNDCWLTDDTKPSIDFIESQSDKYIEDNIRDCLKGFDSFKSQGFLIEYAKSMSAKTTITEEDIVVLLEFDVNASLDDRSTKLTRYFTRAPLGFRDFYDLAEKISFAEKDKNFLEYVAKQLIGVYGSGEDTSSLPPIYYREESYVPKIWSKTIVENKFKSLLSSYTPMMGINGTANGRLFSTGDPMTDGLYRSFYYENLMDEELDFDLGDFSVNFYYLEWPLYFYVGPSRGDLLQATNVMDIPNALGPFNLFPSVPIREYAFFYDISYPVIVELRRNSDLFGEGYSFFFALESNIRDNRDMVEWTTGNGTYGSNVQDLFTWVSLTESELPDTVEEAEMSFDESVEKTKKETKSLFCNADQRISGNVTIHVSDAFTNEDIEGVGVKFGCGNYKFCVIGSTQFDLESSSVILVTKLPICRGGGIIKLEKDGYLDEIMTGFSVSIDEGFDIDMEMTQVIEKEVSIVKYMLKRDILYWNPNDNYGNNYTKLFVLETDPIEPNPENDSILIMIRKVDSSPFVKFTTQFISYDSEINSSTIRLVPGNYEVKTTFTNEKGSTILPDLRCKDNDNYKKHLDGDSDSLCYHLPEEDVVLDQSLIGGLEINNVTGYWRVSEEDLIEENRLELRILQFPHPIILEDLDEMGLVESVSDEYRSNLEPDFIS
ncbi:hypothetical protein HQ545_07355 [Candidatus Woesearchaeota archaeon]|nr:hypothetical protein [Candidatus Woesearchaeota archaeon]